MAKADFSDLVNQCAGVLYNEKDKSGHWTIVGIHNGKVLSWDKSKQVLSLNHVSNASMKKVPLNFYPSQAAFDQAKDPHKFGIWLEAKKTPLRGTQGGQFCFAFSYQDEKKKLQVHNGRFLLWMDKSGDVHTDFPIGKESQIKVLFYRHWNIKSLGSGRYQMFSEIATRSNIKQIVRL